MFSNSTKYALKAVLYLAVHSNEDQKIMAKDISAPINVPKAYIAKLLQELSRKGLISSVRGPKGGFYLSAQNKEHTLIEIIEAIGDTDHMRSCWLSLEGCDENRPCPLHAVLASSKSKILQQLERKSINETAEEVKAGISFLPL
ncbi:RrF2 family transcriptional regulator [Sungkyunkwania multivorans]|uniref:RrF2 family transcriptional regulator n=1 Tax=Sungkyunkwania multivorans TaxID=1173618 RepID=A0ABW3D3X3_9FLAO